MGVGWKHNSYRDSLGDLIPAIIPMITLTFGNLVRAIRAIRA